MSPVAAKQPIPKPDRIDPITTSVIQGALENIAVAGFFGRMIDTVRLWFK